MANKTKKKLIWPVINYAGEKVKEVELPADLFQTEVNEYAVQRAVRVDLSNRRVATAHVKTRDIVHGSNRKPYGQKHTGRARAGTTNSPIWRHGGVVHGPNGEQSYKLSMNKKEHYIAFTSVLTDKVNSKDLIILTSDKFSSNKTKDFVKALLAIGADDRKNLLVLSEMDENLILAARNVTNVELTSADNISVYDVLNSKKLILVENVIPCDCDDENCECHNHSKED